jgi:hypothetical protein
LSALLGGRLGGGGGGGGNSAVLFVVMAFVPNCANARLLDLSLGSVLAFHPGASVLVVDSDSPRPDLLAQVVARRRRGAASRSA